MHVILSDGTVFYTWPPNYICCKRDRPGSETIACRSIKQSIKRKPVGVEQRFLRCDLSRVSVLCSWSMHISFLFFLFCLLLFLLAVYFVCHCLGNFCSHNRKLSDIRTTGERRQKERNSRRRGYCLAKDGYWRISPSAAAVTIHVPRIMQNCARRFGHAHSPAVALTSLGE